MTWTQTTRGRKLDLLNPKPDDVNICEIALALGNQCRYAGCVRKFYSVAEHCFLVSVALQRDGHGLDVQLAGLLHDAAEAYTGDITWPMQAALWGADETGAVKAQYRAVQYQLDALIAADAGLDPLILHSDAVKEYDLRILLDERDALLGPPVEPWYPETIGLKPLGVTITGDSPSVAAGMWWRRFEDLQERRGVALVETP